jgi:hypothetical protein
MVKKSRAITLFSLSAFMAISRMNFFTVKTCDVLQVNALLEPVHYVIILLTLTLLVGHSS